MGSRIHRRRRVVQAVLVVFVLGLAQLFASTASATNFGSVGTVGTGGTTNGVWLTDGSTWTVARMSLTSTNNTETINAVANDYSPTDINGFTHTPANCTEANSDLCVFDDFYGNNGLRGWNACAGTAVFAHPNQQCWLQWVRYNETFSSPPANVLACHELGHSLGLRHTSDTASCMLTTGPTSTVLTNHDRAHLNAAY